MHERVKWKLKFWKSCVSIFIHCRSGHCLSKSFFTTHACFYVMELKKQENTFCTSEASLCLIQKNNFCMINKMKLQKLFFSSKNVIFLYFKNIFYHVTLENIFRILNNSVYFQNIVVCNEPLKITFLNKLFWWSNTLLYTLASSRLVHLFLNVHLCSFTGYA